MVIPIGYLNCHTNVDPKPSILVIEALAVLHLTNKQQFLGGCYKDHIFRMLKRKRAKKKTCLKNKDSSSNVIQAASNMHLAVPSGWKPFPVQCFELFPVLVAACHALVPSESLSKWPANGMVYPLVI